MKCFYKIKFYILLTIIYIFLLSGCDGNAINEALNKREETLFVPVVEKEYYEYEVTDIEATQVFGSKDILLSWTNPKDNNFKSVFIIRKENNYATSVSDPLAKFIYTGSSNSFLDSDLSADIFYYYTLFCKSKDNKYSLGKKIKKEVIDNGVSENPYYEKDISELSLSQVPSTTNISINWTNPVDSNFDGVLILRKVNSFPLGYNDSSSEIIYFGTQNSFLDLYLVSGTKYCYTIYSKDKNAKFSKGVSQSITLSSAADITYNYDVTDFKAQQGKDNREVSLTWFNPTDSDFVEVKLLRRTDQFPTGYNDGSATVLYTGTNQRYTDSNLTPGNTYYYSIYSRNKNNYYSSGVNAFKEVTENQVDIRRRSFFLIGGSSSYPTNPHQNIVSAVDMFDPLTETLYEGVTTMPTPKYFCAATSVNGKIYVFGGFNSTGTPTNTLDILDIDTLTWTTGTALTGANRAALQLVNWNNKIYTLGGTSTANAGGATADGRRYDPVTNAWMADNNNIYADITTARVALNACAYNGMIYYWGGGSTTGAIVNTAYYYNILNNSAVLITANATMTNLGATSILYTKSLDNGRNKVIWFIIGGGTPAAANTGIPHPNFANYNNNTIFMLELPSYAGVPSWLQLFGPSGSLNQNRAYAGGESYGDYLYIFGGVNGTAITSIERLNIDNGSPKGPWQNIGNLGTPRYGFAITKVNQ